MIRNRLTKFESSPLVTSEIYTKQILCHKCGDQIVFDNKHISPYTKKKIPLDPFFNNQPHAQHCMYSNIRDWDPDTEPLLMDFLSLIPPPNHKPERPRRIIGAVGHARE